MDRGGVAKSKDTSGLLMSLIRTLSSSADFEQREKEKARLEKAYKESDRKLDKLVAEHYDDLSSIIQAYSGIEQRITASRGRIKSVKESLQSCKNLLHCKRDDLRKLWIEGIEHKTVVSMLDQIEKVRDVPEKLNTHMNKKHYLHATDLLVSAVSLVEGNLSEVEALRDLKFELITKKEELHLTLIDELHKQVYIKSTSNVIRGFQRHGSVKGERKDRVSVIELTSPKSPNPPSFSDTVSEEIVEDLNTNPEDNQDHFIAIMVESLSNLKKLPETIEAIRSRLQPELMSIVQRAAQQVADNAFQEGEVIATQYNPRYLLEYLELIFAQFRCVAKTHKIVLKYLAKIQDSSSKNDDRGFELYTMGDVWSKVQDVIQLLLADYLDVRNASSAQQGGGNNYDDGSNDIASYFAKKRPNRQKKSALFRFDASSHAISMNSYFREQRQDVYGMGDILSANDSHFGKQQFVCKAGPDNITAIYNPLKKFIVEIEIATEVAPGSCTLQTFITDFVANLFLGQVHYNITNSIDTATKGFDALRSVTDQRSQKELGVSRPILQSTVAVYRNILKLRDLMNDLPDYADQFLHMICKILEDYKETCNQAYKGIVSAESEDQRIISATWAKDEDISRLLRSLPIWSIWKQADRENTLSEADMRVLNSKESDILTSNLASVESLIPLHEIIHDIGQLRTLGNMHESLDWFANRIKDLTTMSTNISTDGLNMEDETKAIPSVTEKTMNISEKTMNSLLSLATDFEEISEVCILVLHLEVRVHCFYYLMPVAKQSNYCGAIDDMDPDSNVLKLNRDLTSIEEAMAQSLQPKKFKYVFEGLGHLVSTILINSTQYLKRINENGIKKMCRNIFAVQQNMTNITMSRESDLDHARQYYELLYLTADDILRLIMEQGGLFTELEYMNALSLLHRSQPGSDQNILQSRLQRLKEILREQHV
ncbi:unnamed protein product [Owenia fusiformis]|uniref:Exocyst complex component Sec8 n=1 Tax=Owenia fusiformis TaxID=6347 RepID=A0A8S4NTE1_OWEFU|nr:unnamed protein product [Owenia fusiformis]